MNIQQTRTYLAALESALHEDNLTQDALAVCMNKLYKLFEQLMDETFTSNDQELKPMLAMLEKKARGCLGKIKSKLAILN